MSLLRNSFLQSAYWSVNKEITKYLDFEYGATILLSDLVSRYFSFKESNLLDEEGGFFLVSKTLEDELGLDKRKRIRYSDLLKEKGLIDIKIKPASHPDNIYKTINFYYIKESKIEQVLMGGTKLYTQGVQNSTSRGPPVAPLIRIIEEDREEREKISSEQVYRSWLASLPQSSNYNDCYDELLTLFTTLHSNKLKESDISSSLKKKIMSRWERSKYPIKQANAWDRAAGEVWSVKLEVHKKEKKPKIDFDKIDIVISNVIDDDELDKIMKENEVLMKDLEDAGD